MIERGLHHPVLGPLLLVLLAVALGLVALHETADEPLGSLLTACAALAFIAALANRRPRPPRVTRPILRAAAAPCARGVPPPAPAPPVTPLRL